MAPTLMYRFVTRILLSLLLAGVPSTAEAQLDCVVPTRERAAGGNLRSAALAPIRTAALAVEAIVKANAAFMAGDVRPMRVRTTIDYSLEPPHSAIVNTVAYNAQAWVKGRCDVIEQADRGGGLTDGAIHVVINDPRSFLGPSIGDTELEAMPEPASTGQVAGFPEYNGMYVLLSGSGRPPWIPVTIAEALDREERELRRRQAEWTKTKERPSISEARIQEAYVLLKKINPAAAEEQRAAMLKVMKDEQARRPKMEAETDAMFAKQAEDLRAYRASFPAARLQAQASLGGGQRPGGGARVDDPKGRRLVRVDPVYARLDPNRVHLLRVFRGGVAADPVPGRYAWVRRSNDTLDYAALAALLK